MEMVIESFFDGIGRNNIEVYNEFSLQHELGIYLRQEFGNKKVQFERNVSHFGWDKQNFEKKEIDISIIDANKIPKTAIELKYPTNGQYPEQMYSFCKDIVFAEQLRNAGFDQALAIILVDDENFHSDYRRKATGIYSYFRPRTDARANLTGKISKPTGEKQEIAHISGCYKIDWRSVRDRDELKYALIHVC